MTKEEFKVLLDRYLDGTATEQERLHFDQFFQAFQQQSHSDETWELTERDRVKLEIYASLNQRIDAENRAEERPMRTLWWWGTRVAASLLLVVVSAWLGYTFIIRKPEVRYLTQTTARGERMTIPLSDGSVIKLNAGSSITYPETFDGTVRAVTLTGEAFFSIQRDPSRPFHVQTGHLKTTVLGTSFNIRAYAEEPVVEVTVKTGKVQVAPDQFRAGLSQKMILSPEQQARYQTVSGAMEMRNVSTERYLAWTSDIIYLDNTTIRDMASTLEKWYDIQIKLENEALGDCLVSGKYKSDRLGNILDGLHFMQGITYRYESDRILILSGKPCK